MNYIIHLNAFLKMAAKEEWVVVNHYALYMALFHIWNKTGFRKTFSLVRKQGMSASKISSKTTYYRCLKELEEAQLLKYYAGKSPFKPAEIEMIPLSGAANFGTVSGSPEGQRTEKKGTLTVPAEDPLLQTNNKNFSNSVSNGPTLDDVLKLFIVHEYDTGLGLRFWYHYQACGWMIGQTPTRDWEALAHKWVLNADSLNDQTKNTNDFNYDEPL